jgi:hypothetical protein
VDPAAPARRAGFRHARRKELPAVIKNRNYPQPVKHPKPTALGQYPLGPKLNFADWIKDDLNCVSYPLALR